MGEERAGGDVRSVEGIFSEELKGVESGAGDEVFVNGALKASLQ